MHRQVIASALLLVGSPARGMEPPDPRPVTVASEGSKMHGRFFRAAGEGLHPALLLIPGWPGNPRDVLGLGEEAHR